MVSVPKEREEIVSVKEQLLVQCPSCQTKFGVDGSLVGEFAIPRFHCSRCDNVFEVEHYRLFPRFEKPIPQENTSAVNASNVNALPHEAATVGRSSSARRAFAAPRSYDPSIAISPPQEYSEESSKQMTLGLAGNAQKEFEDTEVGESESRDSAWEFGASDSVAENSPLIEGDAWDESILPVEVRKQSFWMGFLWIAGPTIIALTLCAFVGYAIISMPSLGTSLFSGAFSASPKAPPAGLLLEETQWERITLESGDSLYALRGVMRNGSSTPVTGIVIEGVLFNQTGEAAVVRRVPANSTLARTRIKSLTLDMVEDLQGREHTKELVLEPGERHEVLVALPISPGLSISSFLARVYSVD